MRWSRTAAGAGLVVAALILAGCSQRTTTSAVGVAGPDGRGQPCDFYDQPAPSGPTLTPLPADSVLVSATRCVFDFQTVPGDGEWIVRTDQRADSGLEAVAAALRLPSRIADPNTACSAVGHLPIVITVTDTQGRQLQPELPHAACGEPLAAAVQAIEALPWITVATHQVRQSRSQLEVGSGCPGEYKPVIAMQAADASGPHRVEPVPATAAALQVCRYALDPDNTMPLPLGQTGTLQAGKLAGVSTLDSKASLALLVAVAAAPPATVPCTQPQAPFADIWPPGGGGPHITVELASCYRVYVDGENYLRQLDPATVTRLFG